MSGLNFNPENSRSRRKIKRIIFIAEMIVIVLFAYLVFYCFGTGDKVNGKGMQPTLNTGDTAVINRIGFRVLGIDRYDVIAFERDGETIHRRVVGLPGETVSIRDGQIYINDTALASEHLPDIITNGGTASESVTLGSYEYFVIGDNINGSEDSRSVNTGNIQRSEIIGTVWLNWSGGIHFSLID